MAQNQEGSVLNQLLKLSNNVKKHEEVLDTLKDVPRLLKKLLEKSDKPKGQSIPDNAKAQETFTLFSDDEEHSDQDEFEEVEDDAFQTMMDNIGTTKSKDDGHDLKIDEDPSILEMFQDVEKNVEYGQELAQYVADGFQKTVTRPLSSETSNTLKENFKVPSNCKPFVVPKMNPEIWGQLDSRSRVTDLKYQQLQQTMSYGLVSLANIANFIATRSTEIPSDFSKSILRISMDGANLLGAGFQQLTAKRRLEVKPHLNSDYASICTSKSLPSEHLFGNDLNETLKASKNTAGLVKKTLRPMVRTNPYTRQGTGNLNRYRPSSQPTRGGGYFQQRKKMWNPNRAQITRPPFRQQKPSHQQHQ